MAKPVWKNSFHLRPSRLALVAAISAIGDDMKVEHAEAQDHDTLEADVPDFQQLDAVGGRLCMTMVSN
jgi:hypothetical protein